MIQIRTLISNIVIIATLFSALNLFAEEDLRDEKQKMKDVLSQAVIDDKKENLEDPEDPEEPKRYIIDANVELSNNIKFGGIFELRAHFERSLGERFLLPGSLPSNEKLQVIGEAEQKIIPLKDNPKRVIEEIILHFLPLDLGELKTPEIILNSENEQQIRIPEQVFEVKDESENVVSAQGQAKNSPSGTVAPEEQAQLMSGKPFYTFKVEDLRYRYGAYALLSFLLLLLIYRWLKRHNFFRELFGRVEVVATETVIEEVKRPAGEVALERLEILLASHLLTDNKVTEFVSRLMDEVLRPYLEDRFSLHAPQQTTAELCQDLLKTVHQGLSVQSIRGILEQTDLIKFAKAAASTEMAHEMAQKVRQLIIETEIKPDISEGVSK